MAYYWELRNKLIESIQIATRCTFSEADQLADALQNFINDLAHDAATDAVSSHESSHHENTP